MNQKDMGKTVHALLQLNDHFASVTKHNDKQLSILCDDGHRYKVSLTQMAAPASLKGLTQDR